jgi:hypothetical protein
MSARYVVRANPDQHAFHRAIVTAPGERPRLFADYGAASAWIVTQQARERDKAPRKEKP